MSCVLRISSGSKFLSSIDWDNWMHLDATDIKLLVAANFIDDYNECPDNCIEINKLENITVSVVPDVNIADDPLNKFIGIEELHDALIQTFNNISTDRIINSSDTIQRSVLGLLTQVESDVRPTLEEAVQKRLDVLTNLKKERVDNAFKKSLKVVNTILGETLTNKNGIESAWQAFVQKVKASNLPKEAKKVLTYPVVKEQLTIAENKYQIDDNEKVAYYLETINPFLKEGLIKDDERIVNDLSNEIAKHELEGKLILQYKSIIEEGILDAKLVDEFLNDAYNAGDEERASSNLYRKVVEEAYSYDYRKAVSIYLYFVRKLFTRNPNFHVEKYDDCENISQDNIDHIVGIVGTRADWRHRLRKFKNPLCKAVGEKFRRRHVRTVPALERLFNVMLLELIDSLVSSCKSYKKETERFSEENATKMAESLNKLLETQYTEVQESDIKFLKTQLSKYTTYFRLPKDILDVPDNLKKFQGEMETLAVTLFDFTPGLFIFSESYFDVLEKLYPVSNNQIENDLHVKSEL